MDGRFNALRMAAATTVFPELWVTVKSPKTYLPSPETVNPEYGPIPAGITVNPVRKGFFLDRGWDAIFLATLHGGGLCPPQLM